MQNWFVFEAEASCDSEMAADYLQIQKELFKALRGRVAQTQFNQQLGFRSNKIHRWESGQTVASWADFSSVCVALDLPLNRALKNVVGFSGETDDVARLVNHLLGERTLSELGASLGVSQSMISRWKAGKIKPSFPQVLQFIDVSFFSLPEFVSQIAGSKTLPSIAKKLERERKERQLHYDHPWIAALLLYMRTLAYDRLPKHLDGFLAKKLGISLALEREVMKQLLSFGAIQKEKGREIFEPTSRSLSTTGDEEGRRRVLEYWTDRCLKTIKKKTPDRVRNSWGYMVFNTSQETLPLIRERYISFYQDVHRIVQESSSVSDQVYVLNVQMLNVEDLEK